MRTPENPGAASGALPNGLYVAPLWAVGAAGAVPVNSGTIHRTQKRAGIAYRCSGLVGVSLVPNDKKNVLLDTRFLSPAR